MKYAEADAGAPVITEVVSRVEDRFCTLRWRWPDGVQAVYIHKASAEAPDSHEHPPPGMKLYTREEYKANNGYRDRLDEIGMVAYTIYVRISENGETLLVRQQDGGNRALVSAGKARIYYAVQHKKGLFSKLKTVQMTITAEVPVPKEVLCYVKKRDAHPSSKEDGARFPFVQDFAPGRNQLPPIEVGKDDFIRIFSPMGLNTGRIMSWFPSERE